MKFLTLLLSLLLLGCAAEEHQDLREWMRDEAKGMRGKVAPLPEITAFQPLEAFPIEDLRVMGIIMAGSVPYALIQTPPPNKPKHVRVGEYMGRSFGKITAITSEAITVLETVKDANGAWVSQERQLAVSKGGR